MRRGTEMLLAAVTAVLLLFVAAASAGAAQIEVTASGGCTLAVAVADVDTSGAQHGACAGAAVGANTIVLPAGTITVGGSDLVIAPQASGLTIEGASTGASTLSAALSSRAFDIATGAAVTIKDLTITGGLAREGGAFGYSGGAIVNAGTLTLDDDSITDSFAASATTGGAGYSIAIAPAGTSGLGGAIYNTGTLTVSGSTFAANRTGSDGSGGAIASFGGTATITNSTLDANTAALGGGVASGADASTTLISDTVAGNEAVAGGGIFAQTPDTAAYSLAGTVAQNTLFASNGTSNCDAPALYDGGGNLSYAGTGCPSTFKAGYPNLQPLANNGGPTETMRLGAGSAAIDASPLYGSGCRSTDQRGVARGGKACDIGAYQVEPPVAVAKPAAAVAATTAAAGATITLNSGAGTATVNYGTNRRHLNHSKTVKLGASVASSPFKLTLTKLTPGRWTYYDVTVKTADGTATTRTVTFKTKPKPSVWAIGVSSTAVSYRDNDTSSTKLTLQRCTHLLTHGACTSYRTVSTQTHRDRNGKNKVSFTRRLGAGHYQLRLTPSYGGLTGKTVARTFAVS
jgi:hypothetical protein